MQQSKMSQDKHTYLKVILQLVLKKGIVHKKINFVTVIVILYFHPDNDLDQACMERDRATYPKLFHLFFLQEHAMKKKQRRAPRQRESQE